MSKPLFSSDNFVMLLIGILIGITISFFVLQKEIDGVIKDKEKLAEKEAIIDQALDFIRETETMTEWNKKAVIKENIIITEEGK